MANLLQQLLEMSEEEIIEFMGDQPLSSPEHKTAEKALEIKEQKHTPWFKDGKWLFGAIVVPLLAVTLTVWLSQGNGQHTSLDIDEMNGGVINTNANIGVQEINYNNETNPSFENQRRPDLARLDGEELIKKWFELMDEQNWRGACSLLSKNDCDIDDGESINKMFNFMRERTVDGFEEAQIQHSSSAPENIWCVKYHYTMAQSAIPRKITEVMQYKLTRREDDSEEITTRLCEKQWKEGIGEDQCTAKPSTYYCLGLEWL